MSEDSRQRRSHTLETLDGWLGGEVVLELSEPSAVLSAVEYRGRLERGDAGGYRVRAEGGPVLRFLEDDPMHDHDLDEFACDEAHVRIAKTTGPLKGSSLTVRVAAAPSGSA